MTGLTRHKRNHTHQNLDMINKDGIIKQFRRYQMCEHLLAMLLILLSTASGKATHMAPSHKLRKLGEDGSPPTSTKLAREGLKSSAIEKFAEAASETVWVQKLEGALNYNRATLSTTPCEEPTQWWFNQQLKGISRRDFLFLIEHPRVLELPFVYKFAIDKSEEGEYFGINGKHTLELKSRHNSTELFWEATDHDNTLNTSDILLFGVHGSDLEYDSNLVPTIRLLWPNKTIDEANEFANSIQATFQSLPGGFNNPLLTFNALAVEGYSENGEDYSDSILIGDGILKFLDDVDLERDGPDFVHAHEFGHHMQFEVDIDHLGYLSEAEESRRIELMADAFGGYFLAHDRGGDMEGDEIRQLHETAMSLGDCDVEEEDHHGKPNQRKCAALWGAHLATKTTRILHPKEFRDKFDTALNDIVNLDPDVCRTGATSASWHSGIGSSTLIILSAASLLLV